MAECHNDLLVVMSGSVISSSSGSINGISPSDSSDNSSSRKI